MQTDSQEPKFAQFVVLDPLVRERLGEHHYALFFVTGEGRYLPVQIRGTRLEELSGYVLDDRDEVFRFWLGWDPQRAQPALIVWERVTPDPDWMEDAEYREARAEVGLTSV